MVDEKGQLILVAAIIVATAVLGSVILLNTVYSSASLNTYQNDQSLKQAEYTSERVQSNLADLFFVQSSVAEAGAPLPYVNDTSPSEFGGVVDAYEDQSNDLTTLREDGLVDISIDSEKTGYVIYQNNSGQQLTRTGTSTGSNWTVAGNGDNIPYLYLNVTDVSDIDDIDYFEVELEDTGEMLRFETDGRVSRPTDCSLPAGASEAAYTEVELYGGSGEIRYNGTVDCSIEFGTGYSTDRINFTGGQNAEGAFSMSVTASGSSSGEGNFTEPFRAEFDGKVVETEFTIGYSDPNVVYEGKYELFGRDS